MVRKDVDGNPVFLFRHLDAVVELCVMQRQSAVDGKVLKRFLILGSEREAVPLIDHLDDAYDLILTEDGHAKDRPSPVARLSVNRPVESGIRIGVGDVEPSTGGGHLTGDSSADAEADLVVYLVHAAHVEDARVELSGFGVDEKEGGALCVNQLLRKGHHFGDQGIHAYHIL